MSEVRLQDWQIVPDGAGFYPINRGGRGAGDTFAGGRFLADQITAGLNCFVIGPSLRHIDDIMITGDSGIRRHLKVKPVTDPRVGSGITFENGAKLIKVALVEYHDLDRLRTGPFDAGWADDMGLFADGLRGDAWWEARLQIIRALDQGMSALKGQPGRFVITGPF